MQVHALNRPTSLSEVPFEKVAQSKDLSEKEKIGEACRQFEAVLLRQILTDAQKPMVQSALMPSGSTNAIYQDMITTELAQRISQTGSFGFAQVLEKELTPRNLMNTANDENAPAATYD